MTSRLDLARGIVIVTSPPLLGHVFTIIRVEEPRGRAPTFAEQAAARPPYEAGARRAREVRAEPPDDALDDAQALAYCWREQEREPVDLLSVAA